MAGKPVLSKAILINDFHSGKSLAVLAVACQFVPCRSCLVPALPFSCLPFQSPTARSSPANAMLSCRFFCAALPFVAVLCLPAAPMLSAPKRCRPGPCGAVRSCLSSDTHRCHPANPLPTPALLTVARGFGSMHSSQCSSFLCVSHQAIPQPSVAFLALQCVPIPNAAPRCRSFQSRPCPALPFCAKRCLAMLASRCAALLTLLCFALQFGTFLPVRSIAYGCDSFLSDAKTCLALAMLCAPAISRL